MKLIIAEKNSVIKLIKDALNDSSYEYLAVAGHISSIRFTSHQKTAWKKVSFENLLDDPFQIKFETVGNFSLKEIAKLKKNLVIKELVLALDPDRQGKYIQKQILTYLEKIKNIDLKGTLINTVNLESLSKNAIIKAFAEKKKRAPEDSLPGELRSRLDFLFGSVLTRYASLSLNKDSGFWKTYNTGRVQTPTLNLIKLRQEKISNFIPEQYQHLNLSLLGLNQNLLKTKDLNLISSILQEPLEVQLVKVKEIESLPKSGLNTDKLLKLLSTEHAEFKIINKATSKLLGDMYLEGLITYPRTDNHSYANYKDLLADYGQLFSKNFNVKAVIPAFKQSGGTDHAPITPLITEQQAKEKKINPSKLKVLKTLYTHSKKIFSGSNYYTSYTYKIKNSKFECNVRILVDRVINYKDDIKSYLNWEPKQMPKTLNSEHFERAIEYSKPPSLYTSSAILKEMAQKNLGTKSTKPTILQTLVDNKYIYYTKDKRIKLTKAAVILIEFWNKFFSKIAHHSLTEEIEKDFLAIKTEKELLQKQYYYRGILKDNLTKKI